MSVWDELQGFDDGKLVGLNVIERAIARGRALEQVATAARAYFKLEYIPELREFKKNLFDSLATLDRKPPPPTTQDEAP